MTCRLAVRQVSLPPLVMTLALMGLSGALARWISLTTIYK